MRGARSLAATLVLLAAGGCATVPPPESSAPVVATPVPVPLPEPTAAPAAAAEPTPVAAEPEPIMLAPLQPRFRLDPDQDAERVDLWQRARDGFALPDLDNDLVRKWEQWYATDPKYVQRMTERGGRYLFHILEEIERREMPSELALLPFIESAFNPQAESRARASGMWQFMPGTGKDFELRQNVFRDDRRDVLASTRAALDYLQRLYTKFNDWQLALAAYNWGPGNVMRALERNRRAGLPQDYANLRMPQETREYVPKLQAVKNIVLRPETFSLVLPPLFNHPFFMTVAVERDIDVALAARLAGMDLDGFRQLNPQLNKPVILAAGTPQLLLPYDNANRFIHATAEHRGVFSSWTAWVAPRTLKPGEAARLTGMNEAQLRDINRIPPRMLVKAGSTLLVPRSAHRTDDVAEHIADNAALNLSPESRPQRTVRFRAGHGGSSVAAVARRYGVSPAQVAQWNGVSPQAQFKAGQSIVVKLPSAAGTRAAGKARHNATMHGSMARGPHKGRSAQRTRVAQR